MGYATIDMAIPVASRDLSRVTKLLEEELGIDVEPIALIRSSDRDTATTREYVINLQVTPEQCSAIKRVMDGAASPVASLKGPKKQRKAAKKVVKDRGLKIKPFGVKAKRVTGRIAKKKAAKKVTKKASR